MAKDQSEFNELQFNLLYYIDKVIQTYDKLTDTMDWEIEAECITELNSMKDKIVKLGTIARKQNIEELIETGNRKSELKNLINNLS